MKNVVNILKTPYRKFKRLFYFLRRYHNMQKLICLLPQDVSIFSSNCFAGRIYQDRNIPYSSPTAGLFFFDEDYVDLLEHFETYLNRPLIFISIDESRFEIARTKFPDRPHWYPIARIEGTNIEIHFLHYYTKEEAETKWRKRILRINFNKMLIIGMEQNNPSIEIKKRFCNLPFEHKIYFCVNEDVQNPCMVYVKEFENMRACPNPYVYAHIYYKYLVDYLNNHKFN